MRWRGWLPSGPRGRCVSMALLYINARRWESAPADIRRASVRRALGQIGFSDRLLEKVEVASHPERHRVSSHERRTRRSLAQVLGPGVERVLLKHIHEH